MDWQHWLDRWDFTQEGYNARREERFGVVIDVVAAIAGPAPRVIDLASGPGSLGARLLDRLPRATVVAVDADPVLHLLGQQVYGSSGGRLRWVLGDLADGAWVDDLGADGPYDAAVSTTALHWLDPAGLVRCLASAGSLVRPGGVLVNGDHVNTPAGERLRALERDLRALPAEPRQAYRPWWDDLEAAAEGHPPLRAAFDERARRGAGFPQAEHAPGLDLHLAALRAAGFVEAGTVRQVGDDRVVVGLR